MKRAYFALITVLAAFVVWVCVVGNAKAAGNNYDANTYQELLVAVNNGVGSTGTAVNVGPYDGIATVVVFVGDPVDDVGTNTVTIQHATASAGTYSTVTNEAGTALTDSVIGTNVSDMTEFKIDLATCHQYIRATHTMNGATGTVTALIVLPK